jgi:hypothetical protein
VLAWATKEAMGGPSSQRRKKEGPAVCFMSLTGLGDRLADIGELNAEDRALLLSVIDAFVTKNRLRALADGTG